MTTFLNSKAIVKLALASGISLLSLTYAYADSTLKVDDNIKVTAINGKSVNKSPFQPLEKTFKLTPGKHVITAKYDRLYELNHDNHDYLRSGNITVSVDIEDNQTYRLSMPGQPERYQEAKKYAEHPTLAVVKGNQIIVKQQSQEDNQGGLFSSLTGLFGGNDSAQFQNQQAIAAIDSAPTNSNSTSQSSNAIPAVKTSQSSSASTISQPQQPVANQSATTLDRFMQIWLQATPEERAKIRQWVQ